MTRAANSPSATAHTQEHPLASASLTRHLLRGAIGFGLIGAGFVLATSQGPAALLLAAPSMVALRGCPTCWLVGFVQTLSAGRLKRSCDDGGCTLVKAS